MQKFLGTKIINAKPMTRLAYNQFRGWTLPADENGKDAGFLVEYVDGGKPDHPDFAGYVSWSPADVFERAYRPTSGMSFGAAIEALKVGQRVARVGWSKAEYLWLLPTATVKAEWCREPHLKAVAEANGGEIKGEGSIRMMTVDKSFITGWAASQTDMLAEDWQLVA